MFTGAQTFSGVAVAAVLAASLYAARGLYVTAEATPHQTGGTYTAVLAEVVTGPDGATKLGSLQTHALRADGATVLRLGPEGEGSRHIRIPSGVIIDASDKLRRKSTVQVPTRVVTQERRDPLTNCVLGETLEEYDGEEVVSGYRAAKLTKRGNDRTSTYWYALDFGCPPIRQLVEYGGVEKSDTRLVALVPGPPREDLFQANEYVEGPPSTLHEHQQCDEPCQQRHRRRDEHYLKLQPR